MELTSYHQLSGPPTRNNDDENTNFLEDTETGPIKRQRNRQIFQWRTRGWKFTLHMASLAGIFVLALNLGFILWAVPRHNVGKYRGVLYDGNCDRVHNLSIGLHLVINILSTTLLGASNYTMQCLGAPTREDIDKAHGAKRWLDIGVPSAKNLKQVSRTRYNSTIFPTVSANEYNVFLGEGSFGDISLEDIKLNEISRYRLDSPEYNLTSSFNRLHEKAKKRTLKQLDNQMCVNAYATTYQTTYGSLLLVSNDTGNANEYFAIDHQQIFNPGSYKRTLPPDSDPYRWLCPKQESDNAQDCRKFLPDIRSQIADGTWTVNSHHVASCLAEVAPPHCKLQYSLPLMTVVVVFIAIKATAICYVSFRKEVPILTVGDAVASFIKSPDKLARGQCLISMKDVRRCIEGAYPEWPHYEKLRFDDKPKQWRAAVPWGRWSFGIISYAL
ncbi:hypothetical protein PHISCL_03669 [Aspergillus sclerotialis]|uniref:DUF6536 domain-containing protein n=1 Tax=Aspergillus sclerotialis TaxID=2070753 RepID=A0A3A2ZXH1_9EURO|nr:hypothetical protein PHISCL_03669 [Aspergillus sclerotialis]